MTRKKVTRHRAKKRSQRRKKPDKFQKALIQLKRLPKSKLPQAMRMANNSFIRQFCSRINRLKHAKVNANRSKVLRSNKTKLRKLVSKRTSIQSKRKLLSQRGGFLPLLLPLIASVAVPLVKGILKRR